MTKVFVISDIHGNYDPLMKALERAGIVDKNGNRQLDRRHKVYSIGDLINGVRDSFESDMECLNLVGPVIDGLIVGNHEIPYFDPANTFSGFRHYPFIQDKLWELLENDDIGPCLVHDKTLITHAGVHKTWGFTSVENAANKLENEWKLRNFSHFLFSAIGHARNGRDIFGGVLWCDFDDELQSTFPQIVGHTPGNLRTKPNALCIDIGAKKKGKPVVIELN